MFLYERNWPQQNSFMEWTVADGKFKALVTRQVDGKQSIAIEQLTDADLPAADVLVDIDYSSFNYKDGLGLSGKNRIFRQFPIIPGIDYAGTVASSDSPNFKPDDKVILTGWGVGEGWSGGFSERARVKSEWLVKLPQGMTTCQAMAIGTAGLTAMLAVMSLERYGVEKGGNVVVSGAAGGVGSIAVLLLSRCGYRVTALTGRPEQAEFLKGLGASELLDRNELANPGKPLQEEKWHGAVDTVGGSILANILASARYNAPIAACGLAASFELPTTVFPFILRGAALLGVDSVQSPIAERTEAWKRLSTEVSEQDLAGLTSEVGLEELPILAEAILAGQVRGRTVVNVRK